MCVCFCVCTDYTQILNTYLREERETELATQTDQDKQDRPLCTELHGVGRGRGQGRGRKILKVPAPHSGMSVDTFQFRILCVCVCVGVCVCVWVCVSECVTCMCIYFCVFVQTTAQTLSTCLREDAKPERKERQELATQTDQDQTDQDKHKDRPLCTELREIGRGRGCGRGRKILTVPAPNNAHSGNCVYVHVCVSLMEKVVRILQERNSSYKIR